MASLHLFVYGTLRRGESNQFAFRLSKESVYAGCGRVRGTLYLLSHYPGLVRRGEGWVRGDLYRNVPLDLIHELDDYEGSEYRREEIEAWLPTGKIVNAETYVYVRPTDGLRQILSGDWLIERA